MLKELLEGRRVTSREFDRYVKNSLGISFKTFKLRYGYSSMKEISQKLGFLCTRRALNKGTEFDISSVRMSVNRYFEGSESVSYESFRSYLEDLNLPSEKEVIKLLGFRRFEELCNFYGTRSKGYSVSCRKFFSMVEEALGLEVLREAKFRECVSLYSNRLLRFDGYVPSLNLLLEYDDKTHFTMYSERIWKRMSLDWCKEKWASDAGLTLLRFHYRMPLTLNYVREFLLCKEKSALELNKLSVEDLINYLGVKKLTAKRMKRRGFDFLSYRGMDLSGDYYVNNYTFVK